MTNPLNILLYGLFYFLLFILIGFISNPKYRKNLLYFIFFIFFFLILFSILNLNINFFPPKYADFSSYMLIRGEIFDPTFLLQALIIYPLDYIFNDKYIVYALNVSITCFCLLILFRKVPINLSNILLIPPTVYYYSLFGLRDPLIFLIFILQGILILRVYLRSIKFRKFIFANFFLISLMFLVRPESSLFLIANAFLTFLIIVKTSYTNKIAVLLITMVPALVIFYQGVLSLGLNSFSLNEISQFSEIRYMRHVGIEDGGGSQILGGRLYDLDFIERYSIQILATIFLPLPFEINSVSQLIAAIDSIFFLRIIYVLYKSDNHHKLTYTILGCLLLYVIVTAFFATNYGNLLRIRYPIYGLLLPICFYLNFQKSLKVQV